MAAGGGVEGCEEAIAGGIDLAAAVPSQLGANSSIVHLEEIRPRPVAERSSPFRRAHDIGEHDRGHDARRFGSAPTAGQELLHLIDDRVGVACPEQEVVSW
jgi:hypothetical protein